jgi:hypothetical protein
MSHGSNGAMFKLNHAESPPVREKLIFVNEKLCPSQVPINVKFGCILTYGYTGADVLRYLLTGAIY